MSISVDDVFQFCSSSFTLKLGFFDIWVCSLLFDFRSLQLFTILRLSDKFTRMRLFCLILESVKGETSLDKAGAGNKFAAWDESKEENSELADEPNFSIITDFGSPSPQLKQKEERHDGGGRNEIMDILDDLTSKLGTMSIQKKKDNQSNDFDASGVKSQVDKFDFDSVKSSFSLISDLSNSSSDVVTTSNAGLDSLKDKQGNAGIAIREGKTSNEFSSEWGGRVSNVGKQNSFSGQHFDDKSEDNRQGYNLDRGKGQRKEVNQSLKTTRHVEVSEKLRTVGRSNAAKLRDLDEDDDCVILTEKKAAEMNINLEKPKKPKKPAQSLNIERHGYDERLLEDEGSITLTGLKLSYTLPGKIATMLYPHQREGLNWLWSLHTQEKGGILGDDMGLGKTMQVRKSATCRLYFNFFFNNNVSLISVDLSYRFVVFLRVCSTLN